MDELTERILAEQAEQKEHPERFQIIRLCGKCKRRSAGWYPKTEVAKFVAKHNSNIIHTEDCEKCNPEEPEEE